MHLSFIVHKWLNVYEIGIKLLTQKKKKNVLFIALTFIPFEYYTLIDGFEFHQFF